MIPAPIPEPNAIDDAADGVRAGFLTPATSATHRARRAGLLAGVVTAHMLLAAWILLSLGPVPDDRPIATMAAFDMSSDLPEPDAPAKRAIVPPVPDKRIIALLPSRLLVEGAPPVAGSGDGKGCSVANAVSKALLADKDAMAELAALAAPIRSEADAVMLWNGAWIDTVAEPVANALPAQIPAVKRVVTDAVLALPAACQEVETAGPQLIPIPEPGRTTMLVIGSGRWRWSNLLPPRLTRRPASVPVSPSRIGWRRSNSAETEPR